MCQELGTLCKATVASIHCTVIADTKRVVFLAHRRHLEVRRENKLNVSRCKCFWRTPTMGKWLTTWQRRNGRISVSSAEHPELEFTPCLPARTQSYTNVLCSKPEFYKSESCVLAMVLKRCALVISIFLLSSELFLSKYLNSYLLLIF